MKNSLFSVCTDDCSSSATCLFAVGDSAELVAGACILVIVPYKSKAVIANLITFKLAIKCEGSQTWSPS